MKFLFFQNKLKIGQVQSTKFERIKKAEEARQKKERKLQRKQEQNLKAREAEKAFREKFLKEGDQRMLGK